jgi:hypothetical protein
LEVIRLVASESSTNVGSDAAPSVAVCSSKAFASFIQARKEGRMTRNIFALVSLTMLALVVASACSPLPTAASPSEALAPVQHSASAVVRLSNLNGTYLGRANKLCDEADASMAIDRLSFDFEVSAGDLSGALLVKCDAGNCMSGIPLGTVTTCPKPPSPCDADITDAMEEGLAPACLTGDPMSKGSVDVLAMTPWQESSTYLVMAFFEETGKRSNTVSTIVGHQAQ